MTEYGKVKLKIDQQLKISGMSKNQLEERAKLQRTQLNRMCNNKVVRIDLETLAKICFALDCNIEDIMEYSK